MTEVVTDVGSPGTVNQASGGYTYAYNNLNTTPQPVLGSNPSRQTVIFHNPGTVDVFIAPAFVQNNGSDVALVPSTGALGGCWRLYANGGSLKLTGEVQKPYQAFAASGENQPLTIMVSNV